MPCDGTREQAETGGRAVYLTRAGQRFPWKRQTRKTGPNPQIPTLGGNGIQKPVGSPGPTGGFCGPLIHPSSNAGRGTSAPVQTGRDSLDAVTLFWYIW
jgi:hypothetical protein